MTEFDPSLWTLFASAFISSTIAPGGSEVILAFLAKNSSESTTNLLLIASTGNTLGALSTLLLGRWAASRWPLDDPRKKKQLRAIHSVKQHGYPLLLLSWLPVVGDGFCFAAGWLEMSTPLSVLFIALGKVLRYSFVIALAHSL